jgi:methionyl-tRNA formyltransferase
MRGTKVFGVSLQTLDEKTFDKGIILDQTSQREAAKFKQMCGDCNYDILLKNITPKGAEILVKGIRNRVFVPPLVHRSWYQKTDIVHAPKITAADRQVDFRQQSASAIDKNVRALGRLWCNVFLDAHNTKRLVFEDFETVPVPQAFKGWVAARRQKSTPPEETEVHKNVARLLVYRDRNDEAQVQIYVEDGDAIIIRIRNHAIRVREITVEGQQKKSAAKVMRGFDASEHWRVQWRARHGLWIERIQRDSNLERARAITEAIAKGRKHEL